MKKTFTPLCCGILFFAAASCKKSQSSPSNSLVGNYKLLSVKAHTYTLTDETDPGSGEVLATTAVADFTSINNGGGVNITADSLRTVNYTYGVNTTLRGAEFIQGQFIDSLSYPFVFTVPPTNQASSYTLIGKDSIYFPAGFGTTVPTGATYKISGNDLSMTVTIPTTVTIPAAYTTQTSSGVETVTLQRQ